MHQFKMLEAIIIVFIIGDMTLTNGKPIIYSMENLQVPSLIASLHNFDKYVEIINRINKEYGAK